LKMLDGKIKQRSISMDRLCESSWTGAHENFQAREYDAGASPTTSECGANTNAFWHMMNCLNVLKFDTPNVNETIKKGLTCRL
jgi:hypothetical protein